MSEIIRPGRHTRLMAHAYIEQDQSTCDRNHVGCVIARDRRIIATGYNGAPAGMPHCDHKANLSTFRQPQIHGLPDHDPDPYAWPPLRGTGCKVAVHAEANAIAFAAKEGLSTLNADLYTTLSPCYECAKLIINAGINRVIYDRPYRDQTGLDLLVAAGLIVDKVDLLK